MGLFSGFFARRRQRESAVPEGFEQVSTPPPTDVKPVGQPVSGAGAPAGPFGLGEGTDISSMFGMLGMIKEAYETGNIQISQGPNQVIDLRGDTDVESLRSQIIAAMESRGIDPEASGQGTEIDASQYAGLQEDLLRVLGEHGIDAGGAGSEPPPDTDGDGQPG